MDKNHLKQLILNVVQNSLHAIGENGKIILDTRYYPLKKKVVIRVVDNGGGIEKKYLKKVLSLCLQLKKKEQD